MADIVDFNVRGSQHRRFGNALHAMPKRRPYSCEELADAKRLVDEIVRAQVQRFDLLGLAVACRQYDDRYIGPRPHVTDHVLAVAIGQPEIEDNDIRAVRRDALDRFGDRRGADEMVIVGFQHGLQQPQDSRLVIDNQCADPAGHGDCSHRNVRIMRVPLPSATGLTADIEPPCASTIPFAIASPSPVPPGLPPLRPLPGPCTNFSNTRGMTSAGMPGPSSVARIETDCCATIAEITRRVPSGACDTTLFTTFPTACSTRLASARISGSFAGKSSATAKAAPRRFAALITRSTISRRSTQSVRSSRAPASMRVIARRFRTISSSPSASALISRSSSVLASVSNLSLKSSRLVADPNIKASGVRKS